MSDIVRFDQTARRSRALTHGGLVYLTGQVADDKTADITTQATQVLAKIDDILAQAGTDRSRLLTAQVWLADMADFAAFNAVWDAWVIPGQTPTRCCGQVALADPAYKVEIVTTAAL